MPSKKDRFDIFKRDGFKCQYCGRTPPDVVLEVDHVMPKSQGGPDDVNNYVTACFDCNRGKSDNLLSQIPESLVNNIERMREKQEQVEEYNEFLAEQYHITQMNVAQISFEFGKYFPGYEPSDNFKNNTLSYFINHLPYPKVREAMIKACSKMRAENSNDHYGSAKALKYFCGICWNWIKKPEMRDW